MAGAFLAASGRRLAGGGWTPASLTDLVCAPIISVAKANGKLWQNSGKSTPASADGDLVRVIEDPFVPGLDFTAPSDAARATLKNSGGLWWLDFDGSDDGYLWACAVSWSSTAHCAAAAVRITAKDNYDSILITQAFGSGFALWAQLPPGGEWGSYASGSARPANTVLDTNDRVLVMDSGNFYYDGSGDGTYAATEGAADDPGYAHLGFQAAGFRCITGRFYGAIACSSSQSGSLDAIDTYLKALQGR